MTNFQSELWCWCPATVRCWDICTCSWDQMRAPCIYMGFIHVYFLNHIVDNTENMYPTSAKYIGREPGSSTKYVHVYNHADLQKYMHNAHKYCPFSKWATNMNFCKLFDGIHSEYRAFNLFRHLMWWQRKSFLQLKFVFVRYYIRHRVKIPFVNNTAWFSFVYDQRAKRFYHNSDIWRFKCQLMGARAGRATARWTDIQSLYMLRFMYLGYCAYIVCPSWKKSRNPIMTVSDIFHATSCNIFVGHRLRWILSMSNKSCSLSRLFFIYIYYEFIYVSFLRHVLWRPQKPWVAT